ncbi:MlaC/ttg2D family ABC transporter substrate-binding protein [Agarivorans sp. Z349TD_8]|uniref:MlaC/ttg2D family ABC transporter substrate-binding protein n=1 Tax=Agarivorans sp. Z349TD_8 TaxID=3421434 RepID=UPI003D7E3DE0
MMTIRVVFLLLLTSLFSATSQAENVDQNPYRLMNYVAEQTFSRLAKIDRDSSTVDQQVEDIVRQQLMPHIDYRYAALVVLSKHLKKTDEQQRARFIKAFQEYLVATYTQALAQYKQQKVLIEPERSVEGQTKVTVKAQFIDGERPPINLSFKFRKLRNKDQWLAYDLVAEGVSLLATKQSEIDSLIRSSSVDEVIELLEKKNFESVGPSK